MIFIIGDKPSKKNLNKDIPFVGTKSYKNLLSWIAELEIDVTSVITANRTQVRRITPSFVPDVFNPNMQSEILEGDKVIALGNNASKWLADLDIKHFKLPHPSPKNRVLNNKKKLKKKLMECKQWLKKS